MDILKRAKEHGESVVMVGATSPGKVTTVDSLSDLLNLGHAGVWTAFASSNTEQLREIACDAVSANANVKIVASPNS